MADISKLIEIINSRNPKPKLNLDSVVKANKNIEFIKRAMDANTPSIIVPGQTEPSTHFMASGDGIVFPTVVNHPTRGLVFMGKYLGNDKDGNPMYNTNEAYDYARKTGNFIKFNNDDDAQYFAENYKNSKLVKIGKPSKRK